MKAEECKKGAQVLRDFLAGMKSELDPLTPQFGAYLAGLMEQHAQYLREKEEKAPEWWKNRLTYKGLPRSGWPRGF